MCKMTKTFFEKTIDNTGKVCYNNDRKKERMIEMLERRTREEMLTEVIRRYGFEDERTIEFARKCESYPAGNFHDDRLECEIDKMKTMDWWGE